MGKFLKLTDGIHETGFVEFADSDEISNIMPKYETSGLIIKHATITGSVVYMKNGVETHVKETPEQIAAMIEGA